MPTVIALVFALVLGFSTPTGAQELATSFNQLRVLVKAGDTLTVIDGEGREFRGQIARLSSMSLEVVVKGQPRTLQESEISTIRLRRADSLANGAKIGFGIGFAFGLIGALAVHDEFSSASFVIPFLATYGALGAGVGVGVDALSLSNDVIFTRPNGRTVTLRAAPIVGPHTKGVRLAVGF